MASFLFKVYLKDISGKEINKKEYIFWWRIESYVSWINNSNSSGRMIKYVINLI